MSLHSEIFEQPQRLRDLLLQRATAAKIAQAILERGVNYVFLAARGTSDNAGRYANYLWGAQNGLPLALATPSLFTYYQAPPLLKNALVVGVFTIRKITRYCQRFGRRPQTGLSDPGRNQRSRFSPRKNRRFCF